MICSSKVIGKVFHVSSLSSMGLPEPISLRQAEANWLASAYPPKPQKEIFTLLGHRCLSYARADSEKLSRYRTIEQGLQNCRNIGHSSKGCKSLSSHSPEASMSVSRVPEKMLRRRGLKMLEQVYRPIELEQTKLSQYRCRAGYCRAISGNCRGTRSAIE